MWLTLAGVADAELEGSSDAVKNCYEKLNMATLELQKRVKELLCDYPDESAEGAGPPTSEQPAGSELEAVGQAARLLGRLCAQPPRTEEGSAPGAIYTPRGIPTSRNAAEADTSVPTGPSKLKPFLLTDVPSLRWEKVAVPRSSGMRQPGGCHGGGAGQRFASNLRVCVDAGALEDAHEAAHEDCDGLRSEAQAELRELHHDTPLAEMHRRMLRNAVESGTLSSRDAAAWNQLCPQEGVVARTRQLLVVLVHTSTSPAEAWACATHAFLHGMAQPDGEAARMLGSVRNAASSGVGQFPVTPVSCKDAIAALRRELDRYYHELLEQHSSEARDGSRLREEDYAAYALSTLPSTYLQMIGQELLFHATMQMPCLAELPERVPDWVMRTLYARPFAEAVRLAVQHALTTAASEPCGPSSSGSDERAPAGPKQQPRFRGVPREKEEPRRREEPQPRQAASSRGARSGGLAYQAGEPTSAVAVSPGATDDDSKSAVERACNAIGLISDIFKDVAAFEAGFGAVLHGDVVRYITPEAREPLPSAPPHVAVAYQGAIREEVARVMRELRPSVRAFVDSSVASAVQTCFSADDVHQAPRPVAVSSDCWPLELEGLSGTAHLQLQTKAGAAPAGGSSPPASANGSARQHGGSAAAGSIVGGRGKGAGQQGAEDRMAPAFIDAGSHRILQLASWLLGRVSLFPKALQPVLAGAALECLSALMDRLSRICTTLREMPGSSPLPLVFLLHSAACCVRQRLEAFQHGLDAAAPDESCLALTQQHGECLMQADELVSSIHQHIVMAYRHIVSDVVLSCLDRTDWSTYRPEVMRGQGAGPSVRLWHSMLLRMLHSAALHASPHAAEWMVGQVLLGGLGSLAQRYLALCPSVQMLREFVADAVHVVATVFLLCQPIPVLGEPSQSPRWLRVPHPMVRALAGTARELLVRAALLHLEGSKLDEVARRVGLVARSEEPPTPQTVPTMVPLAAPVLGRTSIAAGVRLEPLPAMHAARASMSVERAGPVAEGEEPGPSSGDPDPAFLDFSRGASGLGQHGAAPNGPGAAGDPSLVVPPSRMAPLPAAHPRGTKGAGPGVGWGAGGPARDEERLALWSCWMPADAIRALTDKAEVIEVRSSLTVTHHMPLGERMADESSDEASRQDPKCDGRMWRLVLEYLAEHASPEQVLLAVARRHELHAAVGNEPAGNAATRRIVRGLARQLRLLDDPAD